MINRGDPSWYLVTFPNPSSNFSVGSGSITFPTLFIISELRINFVGEGPSGTLYTAYILHEKSS